MRRNKNVRGMLSVTLISLIVPNLVIDCLNAVPAPTAPGPERPMRVTKMMPRDESVSTSSSPTPSTPSPPNKFAISPRMRATTRKTRSPRVIPILDKNGSPRGKTNSNSGDSSPEMTPVDPEMDQRRISRRRTGEHSEKEKKEAEVDAQEVGRKNEEFVREYLKRIQEKEKATPAPKPLPKPKSAVRRVEKMPKSALKSGKRRKSVTVTMSDNVRQYKADEFGLALKDEEGNAISEQIRLYIYTKPNVKSYIGVHYVRSNTLMASECFIETLLTSYRRGIISECFKSMSLLGEKIPAKKRYFLVFSHEEDRLENVHDEEVSIKLGLKMNWLILRQSYVVRIHTKNDMLACFLKPSEVDMTLVYKVDTFDSMLRDCLRSLHIPPEPANLNFFNDHKVMRIEPNGKVSVLDRSKIGEILSAAYNSMLVIAKEWRITVELKQDKGEPFIFDCHLPLDIAPRRDKIFEACSKHKEFVKGTSPQGFELMIDDFVVTKSAYQIADALANGSLILRKINEGVTVKVNIVSHGKEQKIIPRYTIINGYTTPLTIFREYIQDTSLTEKGYRPYVVLRDVNSVRLTEVGEISVTSMLYPICKDRENITLEIEQKIKVPIRVDVTTGDKTITLRDPKNTNFTYRRNFETLLKEVQLYMRDMTVEQPACKVYVYTADHEYTIINFAERIVQYCRERNVCTLIYVTTTAPPNAKMAVSSKVPPGEEPLLYPLPREVFKGKWDWENRQSDSNQVYITIVHQIGAYNFRAGGGSRPSVS